MSSSPIPSNDTVSIPNGVKTPPQEYPQQPPVPTNRSNRPSRACTLRAAERLQAAQQAAAIDRKSKQSSQNNNKHKEEKIEDPSPPQKDQCSKIITSLVGPPEPAQLPRWTLRSMWELASVLNFLHVFRELLNIQTEFSAEEFETALITPNDTLGDIHMPILKAIPPITRIALTRDTWITVLCRKLRDWWHWVADGELPIVVAQGAEIEAYKNLDPGIRVVILKALCDIRVEQDDIRNYIDNNLKRGIHLSLFRKERVSGDSQGINYWYEDDPIIGHRLYREFRKVEVIHPRKTKPKGSQATQNATYQWETVATNFEEFQDVSEKLFASKNRTEASLGKKLKNDMLPEIEKVHKRKEKLLKKQHRQALLLDNFLNVDGLGPGRSLRDRKPVTYTFDDFDRSINEAIKITKQKPPSPEPIHRRDRAFKHEASENGKWSGPSNVPEDGNFNLTPPDSPGYDDMDEEDKAEELDRSNRRRQRPQRYSEKEFVEAVSDNEADFDSDDDIVGEAVYDEEYLRKRKQRRKLSSSSEGDEEYQWDDENGEDEEEEEEEEDDYSMSDDSDEPPQKIKKLSGRTRRETKLRSVREIQSGLRRSKRATRNRINYRQYDVSDSSGESAKPEKSNVSEEQSDASENAEYSAGSQESGDGSDEEQDMKVDQPAEGYNGMAAENYNGTAEEGSNGMADEGYNGTAEEVQDQPPEKSNSPGQDDVEGVKKRRFLDLNELAPGSGFDDGPNIAVKDDDRDNF